MQCIESKTITLSGFIEKAEESKEHDRIRMLKLLEWRMGGKEQGSSRARFPTMKDSHEIPSTKSFIGEKTDGSVQIP